MKQQIFINLAVDHLNKTVAFFTRLGFTFNPQFTDENATCMIIGENIFAMLLVKPFFKGFLPHKEIADAKKTSEVLIAINVETKQKVDEMIKKALEAGGQTFRDSQDHGFMYQNAFQDIDGHIWEIMWLDPNFNGGN